MDISFCRFLVDAKIYEFKSKLTRIDIEPSRKHLIDLESDTQKSNNQNEPASRKPK